MRIFFGPSWCAQWRFRKFFGLQILKDIKVFGAKKLHFNISSNYSGGFLIANCAGKKCTAPCLQGVSIMKMTHNNIYPMRTNPVLTPCKQGAVHFSPRPYAQYRWATPCKQGAVHCVFNENEHLTHTLRSKVRYFHVTPSTLETPRSYCEAFLRWCHQESNRGHKDFQSFALPTELWHQFLFVNANLRVILILAKRRAVFLRFLGKRGYAKEETRSKGLKI